MFDLASLLSPQGAAPQPQAAPAPADGQPPDLQSQWDSFLSNPASKAALLSFGLQNLAGGWGSPGQNIAQSIGAGMEAGGQVGANLDKSAQEDAARATSERHFQATQANEAADRTNKMDIAKLYNSNRLDVANIRSQGGVGPRNKIEQTAWNKAYDDSVKADQMQSQLGNPIPPDQMQQRAIDMANAKLEASRQQFGQPGGGDMNGGLGGAGGNLGGPDGGGGAGGGNVPGGQTPAGSTQMNTPVSPSPTSKYQINPKTGQRVMWNGKAWVPY